MTEDTTTRRSFLKAGALIAAPLAAGAAVAPAEAATARLARLEDEAALRGLHRALVRGINAGDPIALDPAPRSIAADPSGDEEIILAADGRSATGRFPSIAAYEAEIAQDCTLGQMAHAQGCGHVRTRERRLLTIGFVRTGQGWAISRADLSVG